MKNIILVSLVAALTACSTARKISLRPGEGGIIAIEDSEARRGKAESIMQDVCGDKTVRIVEEKESLIGNVIEKESDREANSTAVSVSSVTDANKKYSRETQYAARNEWRIIFKCL